MVDSAQAAPTEEAPLAPVASGVSAGQILQERRAPQRDGILAGLREARGSAGQAVVAPAEVAADPPAEPAAAADPADEVADPAAEPAVETKPPAEVEPPGMAQVRKAEQHARRQLAQERATMLADFEQQKAAWTAKLDKAAALEAKISTARQDPLAALAALGFAEGDYDALGRLIYAHSPEGQKNPATKAAAAAALAQTSAQREQQTAVQKLQAKIDAMEAAQTQREQQASTQREIDKYAAGLAKGVTDHTPLAKSALAKNPERTQARMLSIADRLYVESGPSNDLRDVPTPAQVLAAYEAERIAELEELDIDPKTFLRAEAAKPAAAKPAPAARPAATIAPSGGSAPSVIKSDAKPTREELLAGLAKMRTAG